MSTVIVRIDLDRYTLEEIRELAMMGVVAVHEIREGSSEFGKLSDWEQVVWIRSLGKKEKVA